MTFPQKKKKKKHVKARRQDHSRPPRARAHTHMQTQARTHARCPRHRFLPVQRGGVDAADKPAKGSHQTGTACATAGDALRRGPCRRARGSVYPQRAASYLAAGVFCQVIEDKGREFLI